MRRVVHVLTVLSLGGFFLACSDSSAGAPDAAAESDAGETRDSATTPDTGKPVSDAGAAPDATHASDSAVPHDGGAVNQGPTKVNVRFGACNAPAPCGGDPTGTFALRDACFDVDAALAPILDACPTLTAPATYRRGDGTGSLTVSATNMVGVTQGSIYVPVSIPPECLQGRSCMQAANELRALSPAFNGTSCVLNGNCNCEYSNVFYENMSDAYTKAGTEFTLSGGTYNYCRNGSNLTLNRSLATGPVPLYFSYSQ